MPHAHKGLPLDGLQPNTLVRNTKFRPKNALSVKCDADQDRYGKLQAHTLL